MHGADSAEGIMSDKPKHVKDWIEQATDGLALAQMVVKFADDPEADGYETLWDEIDKAARALIAKAGQ